MKHKVITSAIERILSAKGRKSLKMIDKNCEDAIGVNERLLTPQKEKFFINLIEK